MKNKKWDKYVHKKWDKYVQQQAKFNQKNSIYIRETRMVYNPPMLCIVKTKKI